MASDPNGNVLLPKWFLGFLSILVTVVSISIVPWATSISHSLRELSRELTALSARFDGQVMLQNEVINTVNRRIERIEANFDQRISRAEAKIDLLEARHQSPEAALRRPSRVEGSP